MKNSKAGGEVDIEPSLLSLYINSVMMASTFGNVFGIISAVY